MTTATTTNRYPLATRTSRPHQPLSAGDQNRTTPGVRDWGRTFTVLTAHQIYDLLARALGECGNCAAGPALDSTMTTVVGAVVGDGMLCDLQGRDARPESTRRSRGRHFRCG